MWRWVGFREKRGRAENKILINIMLKYTGSASSENRCQNSYAIRFSGVRLPDQKMVRGLRQGRRY